MSNIPSLYQNLPGYGTVYTESELRQAIALAEVLKTNGGGDASAANQETQIALETDIHNCLSTQILQNLSDLNFRLSYVAQDANIAALLETISYTEQQIINLLTNLYNTNSSTLNVTVSNLNGNPGTSVLYLDAHITEPRIGIDIALPFAFKNFTIQLSMFIGTLTSISCDIQGSNDGQKWQTIGTFTDITDGSMLVILNIPCSHIRSKVDAVTGSYDFNFSLSMVATV